MSNKTQLQSNNIELNKILQNVLDLPNVEDIAEDASSGLYVWKKFESYPDLLITNPSFIPLTEKGNPTLVLSSANFDLSYITKKNYKTFLDGFICNDVNKFYSNENELYFMAGGYNQYSTDYDEKTRTVTFSGNFDYSFKRDLFTKQGTFTLIKEDRPFLNYVVSDEPNAYPDGGEQDGFWYEKVPDLGFQKIAVDKIVSTIAGVGAKEFPHSLQIKPNFYIIYTHENLDLGYINGASASIGEVDFHISLKRSGGNSQTSYCANPCTDTKVTFNSSASSLATGIEYTLITMGGGVTELPEPEPELGIINIYSGEYLKSSTQFKIGMTWKDFAESEYNKNFVTIYEYEGEGKVLYSGVALRYSMEGFCKPDDVIVNGQKYYYSF